MDTAHPRCPDQRRDRTPRPDAAHPAPVVSVATGRSRHSWPTPRFPPSVAGFRSGPNALPVAGRWRSLRPDISARRRDAAPQHADPSGWNPGLRPQPDESARGRDAAPRHADPSRCPPGLRPQPDNSARSGRARACVRMSRDPRPGSTSKADFLARTARRRPLRADLSAHPPTPRASPARPPRRQRPARPARLGPGHGPGTATPRRSRPACAPGPEPAHRTQPTTRAPLQS